MISPYLMRPLRTVDEAEEDKSFNDLRDRHKFIKIANQSADLAQACNITGNIYRIRPRLMTKFGSQS
ncbi:MAG: hypothetical protein HOH46_25585 [Rhodospirillaceae bacterium]|nr:hypothetical protein [Rhodospirillaceae bacterium]